MMKQYKANLTDIKSQIYTLLDVNIEKAIFNIYHGLSLFALTIN